MNKETVAAALLEYGEDDDAEGFFNWMGGYLAAQYEGKDVCDLIGQINEKLLDGYEINTD